MGTKRFSWTLNILPSSASTRPESDRLKREYTGREPSPRNEARTRGENGDRERVEDHRRLRDMERVRGQKKDMDRETAQGYRGRERKERGVILEEELWLETEQGVNGKATLSGVRESNSETNTFPRMKETSRGREERIDNIMWREAEMMSRERTGDTGNAKQTARETRRDQRLDVEIDRYKEIENRREWARDKEKYRCKDDYKDEYRRDGDRRRDNESDREKERQREFEGRHRMREREEIRNERDRAKDRARYMQRERDAFEKKRLVKEREKFSDWEGWIDQGRERHKDRYRDTRSEGDSEGEMGNESKLYSKWYEPSRSEMAIDSKTYSKWYKTSSESEKYEKEIQGQYKERVRDRYVEKERQRLEEEIARDKERLKQRDKMRERYREKQDKHLDRLGNGEKDRKREMNDTKGDNREIKMSFEREVKRHQLEIPRRKGLANEASCNTVEGYLKQKGDPIQINKAEQHKSMNALDQGTQSRPTILWLEPQEKKKLFSEGRDENATKTESSSDRLDEDKEQELCKGTSRDECSELGEVDEIEQKEEVEKERYDGNEKWIQKRDEEGEQENYDEKEELYQREIMSKDNMMDIADCSDSETEGMRDQYMSSLKDEESKRYEDVVTRVPSIEDGFVTVSSGGEEEQDEEQFEDCKEFWESSAMYEKSVDTVELYRGEEETEITTDREESKEREQDGRFSEGRGHEEIEEREWDLENEGEEVKEGNEAIDTETKKTGGETLVELEEEEVSVGYRKESKVTVFCVIGQALNISDSDPEEECVHQTEIIDSSLVPTNDVDITSRTMGNTNDISDGEHNAADNDNGDLENLSETNQFSIPVNSGGIMEEVVATIPANGSSQTGEISDCDDIILIENEPEAIPSSESNSESVPTTFIITEAESEDKKSDACPSVKGTVNLETEAILPASKEFHNNEVFPKEDHSVPSDENTLEESGLHRGSETYHEAYDQASVMASFGRPESLGTAAEKILTMNKLTDRDDEFFIFTKSTLKRSNSCPSPVPSPSTDKPLQYTQDQAGANRTQEGGTSDITSSFRDLGKEARMKRKGVRKSNQKNKTDEEEKGRDRRTRVFQMSDEDDELSSSCGEAELRKVTEIVGKSKRRNSKFFNSQLYQQYSEVVQNWEILRQARSDTLSLNEEASSPKPSRRPLPALPFVLHPHSLPRHSSASLPLPPVPPSTSPRLSTSLSRSPTLWQDLPAVRSSAEISQLNEDERHLQEVRFEVVSSEASYSHSLDIVVDHFVKSKQLGTLLTSQDKNWLFSRLVSVRAISHSFLSRLEEKVESDIMHFTVCDTIIHYCPRFRLVYVPYLTNQSYQDKTYQRLMEECPGFRRVVENLERSPVCQRLSLRSFLILPFQRITRLKLLVQNIVKRTAPNTAEEAQAIKALRLLEKIITDSNDSITQMKSIESLVSLSAKVDFDCKTLPLVSQYRRLVREGPAVEMREFQESERNIYLHLFNDYLMLSLQKEGGRFTVLDYAPAAEVRVEDCRAKLHTKQKNLFFLYISQKALLVRTETQSDKLRWMSSLSHSQKEMDYSTALGLPQVQCVRAFVAQQPDEITLEKADVLLVHQSSDGWVEGTRLSDRQRGWAPESHLESISSKRAKERNLLDFQKITAASASH